MDAVFELFSAKAMMEAMYFHEQVLPAEEADGNEPNDSLEESIHSTATPFATASLAADVTGRRIYHRQRSGWTGFSLGTTQEL